MGKLLKKMAFHIKSICKEVRNLENTNIKEFETFVVEYYDGTKDLMDYPDISQMVNSLNAGRNHRAVISISVE